MISSSDGIRNDFFRMWCRKFGVRVTGDASDFDFPPRINTDDTDYRDFFQRSTPHVRDRRKGRGENANPMSTKSTAGRTTRAGLEGGLAPAHYTFRSWIKLRFLPRIAADDADLNHTSYPPHSRKNFRSASSAKIRGGKNP
jgi:hypothetical protein